MARTHEEISKLMTKMTKNNVRVVFEMDEKNVHLFAKVNDQWVLRETRAMTPETIAWGKAEVAKG